MEKGIRIWYSISLSLSCLLRRQFHQRFTSSFYTRRSQKRQKDSQVKQLFALSGSVCVKAVHKHVDEIHPRVRLKAGGHKEQGENFDLLNKMTKVPFCRYFVVLFFPYCDVAFCQFFVSLQIIYSAFVLQFSQKKSPIKDKKLLTNKIRTEQKWVNCNLSFN